MKEKLLEVKNVSKAFPGVKALDNVQLTIYKGEVHALMGQNGAGKSTLIKVLTGLYEPDQGEIIFDGEKVSINSPKESNEVGIATIYQELNLSPFQTVYENLFLDREPTNALGKIDRNKMIEESRLIMKELNLNIDVTRPTNSFSTAIQQMISIARAISQEAKLVIMDEPTSSLDTGEVQMLFDIIRDLKNKGVAVIFISHKLDEVFEISDRTTILRNGQYIGEYDIDQLTQYDLVTLMIGNEYKIRGREKGNYEFKDAPILLEAHDIHKDHIVNGASLTIKKGEVVGLAGLLGSGRTELANVLAGAVPADSGEIIWEGSPVDFRSPNEAIEAGIGLIPEERKTAGIFPNLSVKENLSMPLLSSISNAGIVDENKQTEVVEHYVDALDVKTPTIEQRIGVLSGGNQQKVILARWMSINPKLLLLDEPTRGIDVGAKSEIEKLIQELSDEGISILMISSEIDELVRNSDRVVVLRDGKDVGELIEDAINQDQIMQLMAGESVVESEVVV